MMYDAYQRMADAGDQVRLFAENASTILSAWTANPYAPPVRRMAAYYELVALAGFTHSRPDYGIDFVEVDGELVHVEEKGVHWTRSASSCASAGREVRTTRRSCSSRRCRAISQRSCGARSAPCCATMRCT